MSDMSGFLLISCNGYNDSLCVVNPQPDFPFHWALLRIRLRIIIAIHEYHRPTLASLLFKTRNTTQLTTVSTTHAAATGSDPVQGQGITCFPNEKEIANKVNKKDIMILTQRNLSIRLILGNAID
jgi:hypothetical protein